MIICNCKGVTKREILTAIKNGTQTITDIQIITKASTGCGRCKATISSILDKERVKALKKGTQLRINFD
ncbi:(2Fe-2S)-binding protein [uncultured Acetobacteroides sp.]|uniref:(2Fe-2S)-binding protein n=1 Tax=uncultured Acetobacteroides sp. TaxID=1760811 RepID=UPI0029F577D3|nr:(2Fe-2S)-binding protein [uncultured Acetobacteroides sp.]